jgi:hypothetical protein
VRREFGHCLREAEGQGATSLRARQGIDLESYVADNKTFCIYLAIAKDEAILRKHAEISGFAATKITEVKRMIDPTTAAP